MENETKQVAVAPETVSHGNWSLNQIGQEITKYDLEYLWIPNLVRRHNNIHDTDNIPLIAFYDFKWWEDVLSRSGELKFSFGSLKFANEHLKDGRRVLFYVFPEADEPPLAKYGAIVIDDDGHTTYYTTEKDPDPKLWYLCNPQVDIRLNYGPRRDCKTLDEFRKQIEALYDGTAERYNPKECTGKLKKALTKILKYGLVAVFVTICSIIAAKCFH